MARIVTLNIGASRVVIAEYAVKGKSGLTLTAYGSADLAGLDWEAEGAAEAILVPALREAAKAAGMDTVMVANPGNTIPHVIPTDVWIYTWLQLLEM